MLGVPIAVLASSMVGCGLNPGPLLGDAGTLPTQSLGRYRPSPTDPQPPLSPSHCWFSKHRSGPCPWNLPTSGPRSPEGSRLHHLPFP